LSSVISHVLILASRLARSYGCGISTRIITRFCHKLLRPNTRGARPELSRMSIHKLNVAIADMDRTLCNASRWGVDDLSSCHISGRRTCNVRQTCGMSRPRNYATVPLCNMVHDFRWPWLHAASRRRLLHASVAAFTAHRILDAYAPPRQLRCGYGELYP
jgi:hypothetical protein